MLKKSNLLTFAYLKKLFTILLALAFIVQSTSQLWIRAAFFANRDYIANNLCINRFDAIPTCKGSCYLENKLAKDKEQQKNTSAELKVKEVVLFFHQPSFEQANLALQFPVLKEGFAIFPHTYASQDFISRIFHPPALFV